MLFGAPGLIFGNAVQRNQAKVAEQRAAIANAVAESETHLTAVGGRPVPPRNANVQQSQNPTEDAYAGTSLPGRSNTRGTLLVSSDLGVTAGNSSAVSRWTRAHELGEWLDRTMSGSVPEFAPPTFGGGRVQALRHGIGASVIA